MWKRSIDCPSITNVSGRFWKYQLYISKCWAVPTQMFLISLIASFLVKFVHFHSFLEWISLENLKLYHGDQHCFLYSWKKNKVVIYVILVFAIYIETSYVSLFELLYMLYECEKLVQFYSSWKCVQYMNVSFCSFNH